MSNPDPNSTQRAGHAAKAVFRPFALLAAFALAAIPCPGAEDGSRQYAAVQERLAQGWNTWNINSVFSHVLLPEGLSVTVGLHSIALFEAHYLNLAQAGGNPKDLLVTVGLHSLDGSYSDLTVDWRGMRVRIQSATEAGDLLLLVTPVKKPAFTPLVDFEVGMLWNRPGSLELAGGGVTARLPHRSVTVFGAGMPASDPVIPASTPFLSFSLAGEAGVSTGHRRSVAEIGLAIRAARERHEAGLARRGVSLDTVEAVESALGWDTIYDPIHGRVISPVSRAWSVGWGGYVLFDWDSFFAGYMAGLFNRDLAYADIVEVLNEATPAGFVPNYSGGRGVKSLDRSQPPVGSIVVLDAYRRFHERWFLAATFERLLRWNRWWAEHRDVDGYLVWGSDPSDPEYERQDGAVNTLQGAKYESGLDNSPMYDAATFDTRSHRMQMADVGLMGLYVADCDALATVAGELGRDSEARELRARSVRYGSKLATLWSPSAHLFLNRDLRTGGASPRTSPTNFYPLLSRTATPEEARQMVGEHLLNPGEFWGEWVVPSTPRNDPAFKEQNYWRGRIWGPMNFLVYLGLRNYDLPLARSELARKSEALLLKEWKARGHVHENYNAITGEGDDVTSSDPLYHWGALLGAMEMLEAEAAPPR